MFSIIGADGKEYGPVSAGKIQEWIAGGRANLQTRARRSNEAEWRTLADFPEFNPAVAAAVPPAAGAETPPDGLAAPVAPVPVPAPLPEPATPFVATAVDAKSYAADLIARTPLLDVFGALGRTFDLWKAHFLPLVGVTLLIFVIVAVLGMIPFLGMIASLVLTGVFYGGLYYYYLGKLRGEPRELGDAFAGFSRNMGNLILANVLTVLITMVVALVLFSPWIVLTVLAGNGTVPSKFGIVAVCGMILSGLPILYLSIAWVLSIPLVVDQGLTAWTAMEVSRRVVTRQWFRVFFTLLLGGILAMLGLIGLVVGVIFTMPLGVGALIVVYESLCPPPAAAVAPASAPVPVAPTVS